MGRPKSAVESVTVNVVFPKPLVEQVDAYVVAFMDKNPGVMIRRSDVVRMAVERLVRSAAEPEPKRARVSREAKG